MARLYRRGIGKFNIEKRLHGDEYLSQSLEGLDLAYEQLWSDAEANMCDPEKSYFWKLIQGVSMIITTPVVREVTKAMNRFVLSAVMFWNAGECPAAYIGQRAGEMFEKWFVDGLLPEYDRICRETDEKLLGEFDGYICETMEKDGVSPVHLRYFSADSFYKRLREIMVSELLPEAKQRIVCLVPTEIRDSRFAFVRRRRLRRGVASFFAAKEAEGPDRGNFVCEKLINDELIIGHANAVLKGLGSSIWAEKIRLFGRG